MEVSTAVLLHEKEVGAVKGGGRLSQIRKG